MNVCWINRWYLCLELLPFSQVMSSQCRAVNVSTAICFVAGSYYLEEASLCSVVVFWLLLLMFWGFFVCMFLWLFVCKWGRWVTHNGYLLKGVKRCGIVASIEGTCWSLLWASSCWMSKIWGLASHALCVYVEKFHLGVSGGSKKLMLLQSLLVCWVRLAAELQETSGIYAAAVGCAKISLVILCSWPSGLEGNREVG